MAKIAIVIIAVEKFPYWFSSRFQLLFGIVISALVFAVIENLLYLNVYVQEPAAALVRWRWSVCTVMHVGASIIASMGVMRMWVNAQRDWSKPQITLGYPYFIASMIFHGGYNFFATVISVTMEPF